MRRAILLGPSIGKFVSDIRDAKSRADVRWLLRTLQSLRISRRDLLIGVDHGADLWFQLGLSPGLAVGDWDSLQDPVRVLRASRQGQLKRVSLPAEKDRSDLSHALEEAVKAGAKELVCLGVTGGRPDHHLAALLELSGLARLQGLEKLRLLGPEAEYHFLSSKMPRWRQRLGVGTGFSVFALSGKATGVSIRGAKYPLESAVLKPSSRGLSNVSCQSFTEVRVKSGSLLVIVPTSERG